MTPRPRTSPADARRAFEALSPDVQRVIDAWTHGRMRWGDVGPEARAFLARYGEAYA
jgi:hypothetical protein